MNHDMMMGEMMAGPSGTFNGHFIPGLIFIFLALWWLADTLIKGPHRLNEPLERTIYVPIIKFLVLPFAFIFEVPNSTWYPMDWVMGWHHFTTYIAFALSGVVDLLAIRKILTARSTYLAFGGACLIGALLFFGHGTDPGVEGTTHSIVMMLFALIGFFSIIEPLKPGLNLKWYRIGSTLSLGVWMCIIAWIHFKSGWDLHDHVRVAHVWLRFSWMILAVTTLTVMANIFIEARWQNKLNESK